MADKKKKKTKEEKLKAFEGYRLKLEKLWEAGIFTGDSNKGVELANNLKECFSILQESIHRELFEFYNESLHYCNAPIKLKNNPQKEKENLKEELFNKIIREIIEAIQYNKHIKNIKYSLDEITKIYNSLFSHLEASRQYSNCQDNASKSK